ncbi:MAG: nicotinate (nicotinamide) nucleotide adenylyltransferase [Vallitaleaceae bacterium]|nr:nicotinate (nicotinamide) nucleotide adenylyltransferase [Vallitaleaceae bacterium]
MKNIAILGGTFNPVHLAHLSMVQAVYATNLFDEIVWMPTGDPPHKEERVIVNKLHRWHMCLCAIEGINYLSISNLELNRTGKTYTVETIQTLKDAFPTNDYYLIIGADSLLDLPKWYQFEVLLTICKFVVIKRPGFENTFESQLDFLRNQHGAKIQVVDMPLMNISSSDIRQLCSINRPIDHLVPTTVADYIEQQKLYKTLQFSPHTLCDLERMLRDHLSPKRFLHSIAVKDTAIDLAIIYKCDLSKVAITALLHDCAKSLTNEQRRKLCKKFSVIPSPAEIESPDLLHAKLGAIIALEEYGIVDGEILEAISCHTTGKPEMSLLEKIVFIADYIEPTRNKAPRLTQLRHMATISLDEVLVQILKDTLDYLVTTNKSIDLRTEETYDYYMSRFC